MYLEFMKKNTLFLDYFFFYASSTELTSTVLDGGNKEKYIKKLKKTIGKNYSTCYTISINRLKIPLNIFSELTRSGSLRRTRKILAVPILRSQFDQRLR